MAFSTISSLQNIQRYTKNVDISFNVTIPSLPTAYTAGAAIY